MTGGSLEIDANPYSAPNASHESVGPLFPWRLIPAAMIGLLGILSFGYGTYFATFLVHWVFTEGITSGVQESLVVIGFYIGPGVTWISSAILIWKKRYLYATLLVFLGLAIPVAMQP